MTANMLKNLCVEIYKRINPEFMNNIFKVKEKEILVTEPCRLNLENPEWTHDTFWANKVKKTWNNGPEQPSFSNQII